MFDAEVSVFDTTISTPSAEALDEGAPSTLELGIITGTAVPLLGPQNPPVQLPIGRLRFTFGRDQAIAVFSAALAAAQDLPEPKRPTNIMTATSMAEVEQAAQNIRKVTGR